MDNLPNNYFQTAYEPKKGIPTWVGLLIISIIAIVVGGSIWLYQDYINNQNINTIPQEIPADDFSALNKNELLHKLFPNLKFENETAKTSSENNDFGLKLSLKDFKEDYFINPLEKSLLLIVNLENVPHVGGLYHAFLGLFDKSGSLLTPSSQMPSNLMGDTGNGGYDYYADKAHFGADNGIFEFNDCKGVKYITFVRSGCPNSTCCYDSATVYKVSGGKFEIVQEIKQESYDVNYAWKMKLSGDNLAIKKVPDHLDDKINECTETDYKTLNWDKDSCTFKENKTADWKTYKNDEYGFEVKYPSNWKNAFFDKQNNRVSFGDGEFMITYYKDSSKLPNNDANLSLDEWLSKPNQVIMLDRNSKQSVLVGGISGFKFGESYCLGTPMLTTGIFVQKNNSIFHIQGPLFDCDAKLVGSAAAQEEAKFSQFISTFKFTK